jgi:predicted nucleic-acid-binding Zn-ribbon protein
MAKTMKTLSLSSLLLFSMAAAFGQDKADKTEIIDKAPPAIEEALRARVNHFYELFKEGKFKEAYSLVADDSQDKFFELAKDEYKSCEIIKTRYTENFTKATVVTACKTDWRFQNITTPMSFPLVSNWELLNDQWYWHYMKPTIVPTPFSPSGFVPGQADNGDDTTSRVPKDIGAAGQAILAKVGVDKSVVQLQPAGTSFDSIHVRNDMPGDVSVKVETPAMPGLKITMGQSVLHAHDSTTVTFEWHPEDPAIKCLECMQRMTELTTVQLRIDPLSRVFPIRVMFQTAAQGSKKPPAQQP